MTKLVVDASSWISLHEEHHPPDVFPALWFQLQERAGRELIKVPKEVLREVGERGGVGAWLRALDPSVVCRPGPKVEQVSTQLVVLGMPSSDLGREPVMVVRPTRGCVIRVLPVILREMKTAISLPDDLFRSIDAKARALRVSRSALLARAARELLERESGTATGATEAWNRAIEEAGQPGDEPAAAAFRKKTKSVVRRQRGSGR